MNTLPFHLLEEIFFKLEPQSLVMMQCTEKAIHSHVSADPYFITEYLSRVESSLLHISTFGSNVLLSNPLGESRLFKNKHSLEITSHILSSCSGLILLFIDGLCVANPLTKRFRFMDHSKSKFLHGIIYVPTDRRSRYKLMNDQTNHIGFAVDQIDRTTQRFKLVCIINTRGSSMDEMVYQFEISNGDSCWRLSETTITCPTSFLKAGKKPVYSNGCLHWLREDGSILAFDPETEQARLVPIKFPPNLSSKFLFAAAENDVALVSATEEVICVYALKKNILTDPKWVLVKQIWNGVLDKEKMRYWNVQAYDGKCLVMMEIKEKGYGNIVHGYDLRANKWGVVSSIPWWCDSNRDFYQVKPSFSSAMELNEKVNVDMMTMMMFHGYHGYHYNRISSLCKIMNLAVKISPKKETSLGKRWMIEEETNY